MQSILGVLSWQWWGVVACILSIMLSNVDSPTGEAYGEVPKSSAYNFPQCASKDDFCNLTKSKIFALPFWSLLGREPNVCYAVAYVLNITDNLNKMFYLIQVAYLYIIIF